MTRSIAVQIDCDIKKGNADDRFSRTNIVNFQSKPPIMMPLTGYASPLRTIESDNIIQRRKLYKVAIIGE